MNKIKTNRYLIQTDPNRIGRHSLISACQIPKGTVITERLLAVKRTSYGIAIKHMPIVIGRKAACYIK